MLSTVVAQGQTSLWKKILVGIITFTRCYHSWACILQQGDYSPMLCMLGVLRWDANPRDYIFFQATFQFSCPMGEDPRFSFLLWTSYFCWNFVKAVWSAWRSLSRASQSFIPDAAAYLVVQYCISDVSLNSIKRFGWTCPLRTYDV